MRTVAKSLSRLAIYLSRESATSMAVPIIYRTEAVKRYAIYDDGNYCRKIFKVDINTAAMN